MIALIMLLILAAVFILLPGFCAAMLFLSIVWMYRPELSVMDIIRETVKEIKDELRDS